MKRLKTFESFKTFEDEVEFAVDEAKAKGLKTYDEIVVFVSDITGPMTEEQGEEMDDIIKDKTGLSPTSI